MKIKRILFLINSLWELARFLLLFLGLGIAFRLMLLADRSAIYWLILLGSGQLVLPAALVMLYIDPLRFGSLLNLARLGKFLGILSSLLLIFLSPLSVDLGLVGGLGASFAAVPYSMVIGVTIVDLVFLFLLFLWNGTKLPEHRETPLDAPSDTAGTPRPDHR
jgi:hypothetical protein